MSKDTQSLEPRKAPDAEPAEDRPVFVPETDIYEKEEALLVRCDLPGVDAKDLEITLEDRVLTISASQSGTDPKGLDLVREEYEQGLYRRSFTVSREIDTDRIAARLENGVLNLELPKAEAAQPKKIAVATAG